MNGKLVSSAPTTDGLPPLSIVRAIERGPSLKTSELREPNLDAEKMSPSAHTNLPLQSVFVVQEIPSGFVSPIHRGLGEGAEKKCKLLPSLR